MSGRWDQSSKKDKYLKGLYIFVAFFAGYGIMRFTFDVVDYLGISR